MPEQGQIGRQHKGQNWIALGEITSVEELETPTTHRCTSRNIRLATGCRKDAQREINQSMISLERMTRRHRKRGKTSENVPEAIKLGTVLTGREGQARGFSGAFIV